jgi:RNA-binding protein YhbY
MKIKVTAELEMHLDNNELIKEELDKEIMNGFQHTKQEIIENCFEDWDKVNITNIVFDMF